ncbi:uncharacterized protein LOC109726669 [Ananas comosus]|uniref:Uncharacterized protein LOC109726669 n=1 Tax=Ananas comosus TaxID=4615 RepID=A0A6P5GTL3_ANACO|nr:uncharacterized protein LOC109726669 [Ananas comosus]
MAEFPHNLRCGGGWGPRPHHAYVVDPAHRSDPSGLVDRTNHLVATIPHPHRPSLLFEGFRPGVPRFGPVGSSKLAQSKALGFTHDNNNNNKKVSKIQQGPGPVRFTAVQFNPVRSTGSGKECGGTGVFLPRVAVNPGVNKKPHVNKGEKQQKKQQYAVVAKETVPIQPPELLLPQEWTY